MKKSDNLKSTLVEGIAFYEKHSAQLTARAEKMTEGCNMRIETEKAAFANKERAIALREALSFVEEFIG